MRSLVLNVVLVFSMRPALSDAQPVDSVEKRWSRMKSGNTVYVTDASARETTGTFVEISDSALTISVQGQDREILFADLRQIVLPLLGLDFGYGLEARDYQVYLAIGLTD